MVLLYGLGLYALLGIVTAVAFVSFGVTQVLPYSMTIGARILVLPGAVALWPYVLVRWLNTQARKAAHMRRAHRTAHRMLWPILALALALGFSLALMLRVLPPP